MRLATRRDLGLDKNIERAVSKVNVTVKENRGTFFFEGVESSQCVLAQPIKIDQSGKVVLVLLFLTFGAHYCVRAWAL